MVWVDSDDPPTRLRRMTGGQRTAASSERAYVCVRVF